jgi:hypothetical protein
MGLVADQIVRYLQSHANTRWDIRFKRMRLRLEPIPPASNRGDSQRCADEGVWRP